MAKIIDEILLDARRRWLSKFGDMRGWINPSWAVLEAIEDTIDATNKHSANKHSDDPAFVERCARVAFHAFQYDVAPNGRVQWDDSTIPEDMRITFRLMVQAILKEIENNG